MNAITILPILCILLVYGACSSTSHPTGVHQYSFIYEGEGYSILSTDANRASPVNYLLQREQGITLLRARDEDLDGILDTLLLGTISLVEANAIYLAGISLALKDGKYKNRQTEHVFSQKTEEGYLAIQSYPGSSDSLRNIRFVIHNALENRDVVFLDEKADGTLDRVVRGEGDLESSQVLYERLLEAGLQAGQVTKTGRYYAVVP